MKYKEKCKYFEYKDVRVNPSSPHYGEKIRLPDCKKCKITEEGCPKSCEWLKK
jgi:hypothetical protein